MIQAAVLQTWDAEMNKGLDYNKGILVWLIESGDCFPCHKGAALDRIEMPGRRVKGFLPLALSPFLVSVDISSRFCAIAVATPFSRNNQSQFVNDATVRLALCLSDSFAA